MPRRAAGGLRTRRVVEAAATWRTDEVARRRLATRHLIDLGTRPCHHAGGPGRMAGHGRAPERMAGRSLPQRPDATCPGPLIGDWTTRSGYRSRASASQRDAAITAVFVANDQMALGVIKALTRAG